MPATHSFSLTPAAAKAVLHNKYPRYLGGASKMVSDAILFFWTKQVVVSGPKIATDEYEQDPVTMACVNCGASHYKREIRIVGDLYANIQGLQEQLELAHAEIDKLKNRKMREILWSKISG